MFFLLIVAASIGAGSPVKSVGNPAKQPVHLTWDRIVSISDELMRADIAEVDIDPAVFDLPPPTKVHKKNALDDIEFK